MGIFSRFSDIVQANINAMLDRAEDPEKMIRMMISEMEETLIEVRTASARIIADKKTADRHLQRVQKEAGEWERKAKLAITKGREDLARAALLEKQMIEEEGAAIAHELSLLDEHLAKLEEEVSQLQSKLNDAKAKEKALKMRHQTATARMKTKRQTERANVDDAFSKFERFEQRMEYFESEIEAMDMGKEGQQDLKQQFADLENDDKLNAELERLKQDMQQQQ
ncbi:phage shock protein PspA [Halioxenophilus sp. WMMB6]|uniref:phage shock protein PspA n=1 Tax=Halioxenophilus sp. WMMB6 TaxID=3073815 RepID=UPI00295E7D64|nr:phage shock protein PspA [Halioxenophilus sp. WMMB6]